VLSPEATVVEGLKSIGVRSIDVANMFIVQGVSVLESGASTIERVGLALDLLREIAPRNATEGMLAVQMIGVHNASVEFLRRSQLTNQPAAGVDANTTRVMRLMRLFTEQLGAMAKLKGTAGQQKMTVEHVHVHAGGQAIVGPVAGGKETPKERLENHGGARNDNSRIKP